MSGWAILVEAAIKVVLAFALLLNITIFVIWFERKVVADMQNRVGPSRAGPYGLLQTVADGVKLIFKESVTPRKVEFATYIAAPVAALVPALLIFLVVPVGNSFTLGDLVARRVRRGPRRLVLRLQVSAPRCGAGLGSDDLL